MRWMSRRDHEQHCVEMVEDGEHTALRKTQVADRPADVSMENKTPA